MFPLADTVLNGSMLLNDLVIALMTVLLMFLFRFVPWGNRQP